MPQIDTVPDTGTRCRHDAERDACPFCVAGRLATGSGTGNIRSSKRLAATLRRALREAERERATVRGYLMLAGTVSAHVATSPVLHGIGNAADGIGRAFFSDVTGDTIDRIARYIGGRDRDTGTVARVLLSDGSPVSYAARLARRVARSIARHTGTGRGTMPTFDVSPDDAERAIVATFRRALMGDVARTAAFTVATGDGARRAMTDKERALVLETFRPERSERSPLYAQWRDGMGDTLPDVTDGHNAGTVAHYVPERDAAPLRRGSLWARLRAIGADVDTVRALRVAWDVVNVPDASGRYRTTVPWHDVRDEIGATVQPSTVQRRARRVARVLRDREANAAHGIGAPLIVPDANTSTTYVIRRTGRGRANARGETVPDAIARDTSPVVWSVGYTWQTVGEHRDDCKRAGSCADGCDALALMPPRDTTRYDGQPLHVPASCPCDIVSDGAHDPACPIRVARSRRVAEWARLPADASPDMVRAMVARHMAERAHGATSTA